MSNIVCFGEVLWDVFPTYKKIGGAPLNVALRLNSFNDNVTMISCVGDDANGKALLCMQKKKGWIIHIFKLIKNLRRVKL